MSKTKTDPITYIETYLNDQPNAVVQLVATRIRAYAKKRNADTSNPSLSIETANAMRGQEPTAITAS